MPRDLLERQPVDLLQKRQPKDLLDGSSIEESPKRTMFGDASAFERLKTASTYGIPAAIVGAKSNEISRDLNNVAPDAYQIAGNVIGGTVGGPGGAAYGGSLGRGFGNVMRDIGRGERPTIESFRKGTTVGAGGELIGAGTSKIIESSVPAFKNAAISLVKSYLKPKGELASKGGEIAQTILDEGLAKGNMGKMLGNAASKAQKLTAEVDSIISKYGERTGTSKKALSELDNLANEYFTAGDPKSAGAINELKQNLIQGRNLNQPVYGDVEKGAFELGGGSLTKPKKVVVETPQYGDLGEALSPTRKKSVIPETTHQGYTRGIQGPSKKVTEVVGEEPRNINLEELQNIKREQYRTLARKRKGGGYGSEVQSPEIEGRQNYASGIKRTIEDAVPEENLAQKNERIGRLIDSVKALSDREPVAGRKNVLDLGDLILGGSSFSNPKILGSLAIKRTFGSDSGKNFIARNLYGATQSSGGFGDIASLQTYRDFLKNKYGRALFGTGAAKVFDN